MFRKTLAASSILLVATLTSGCGGSQLTTAPGQATHVATEPSTAAGGDSPATSTSVKAQPAITIHKTGFGMAKSPAAGIPDYVWATAIIKNTTTDVMPVDVSFTVYDRSGKVLGQSSSGSVLRAGRQTAVGTQVEVPAGSKVGKVVATADGFANLSQHDEHPESVFETKGVHFQPDQYAPRVLGEVVSKYTDNVTNVLVTAVCYDVKGGIIGGGAHYMTSIGSGQTVGFQTDILTVTGTPAKCEAFADLSGASEAK